MSRPIVVIPDPVLAALQYLRGVAALTALVPAASIVTEIPSSPAYPYLVVNVVPSNGGIYPSIEEAVLQLDALDTDHGGGSPTSGKVTANAIARTARAAMWAIANDSTASGAVLCSSREEIGPQWLPDTVPTPHIACFTQRQAVILHG
ncbi:MAG: hypothetical protein ABIP33_06465 [Pseudolysinimonas sp.]